MLFNDVVFIWIGVTMEENFRWFFVDVIKESVETLVGDFVFIVYAAGWTVGDENVDLRIVGENVIDFILSVHDGVGV